MVKFRPGTSPRTVSISPDDAFAASRFNVFAKIRIVRWTANFSHANSLCALRHNSNNAFTERFNCVRNGFYLVQGTKPRRTVCHRCRLLPVWNKLGGVLRSWYPSGSRCHPSVLSLFSVNKLDFTSSIILVEVNHVDRKVSRCVDWLTAEPAQRETNPSSSSPVLLIVPPHLWCNCRALREINLRKVNRRYYWIG